MRSIAILALTALLAAGASPTLAQSVSSADLCLRVESATGLDLSDPEVVQAEIASGNISVVDVVTCVSQEDAPSNPILLESRVGAWMVGRIGRDPETDEPIAVAGLEADGVTSSSGNPIALVVRCAHGEVDLIINWDERLDSGSTIVMSQLGTNAIEASGWSRSTDDEATLYPGQRVRPFIESMYGETRLALRVTLSDGQPTTAVFAIGGIQEALVHVRSVCVW